MENTTVDISKHFDGKEHFWRLRHGLTKISTYRNPTLDVEKQSSLQVPTHHHRDILKRETWLPKDLLRYISPTYGKTFRMVVQATDRGGRLRQQGDWRRTQVKGNAPLILRLSNWVVGPEHRSKNKTPGLIAIEMAGKCLLLSPLYLLVILVPIGMMGQVSGGYKGFHGRCYEYPKHARNTLDSSPLQHKVYGTHEDDKDIAYDTLKEQKRLLRPRKLYALREKDVWDEVDGDTYFGSYLFISYAAGQYEQYQDSKGRKVLTPAAKQQLHDRARILCENKSVKSYWIDFLRAEKQPEATDDVHRFCDVVRGAKQVCVLLAEDQNFERSLISFADRLWCLPECLLAADHVVFVIGGGRQELISLMDFPHRAWSKTYNTSGQLTSNGHDEDFRLLAEHFTGTLSLSRLELIQVSLTCMRALNYQAFQRGDIAYALMTLLRVRPAMDPTDSEQQALARLSLSNDSDRIVERMACMLPPTTQQGWFGTEDSLGANLWDIEPLCQVAGVCHDGGIILDGAHAISIRWKDIPRIAFATRVTPKRLLATFALRSGPLWFLLAVSFIAIGSIYTALGIFFFIICIVLLFAAPFSMQKMYGGKVWGAHPWLIGIEGTMPIDEIEKLAFGSCTGRLMYTPSSGPFCQRLDQERMGKDPTGHFPDIPDGMRLFTLIDTGTLTVTVFAAKRPPSVALICGKEGGMLRTLLCSYERSTNALQKETVLRMETPMWDRSSVVGWVKLN